MRETLQSLQRQVVRQERLAAVGVLVSGVAHELNNPLQAILGTAELLERRPRARPGGARGNRVRQDAERPRARDHPQPLALQQPAVGPAGARRPPRRHRRGRPAAAPRSRQPRRSRLDVEMTTVPQGVRELHRARAGDAELRHQRAAVDRGRRPHAAAASSSACSTPARTSGSKCRTTARASRRRTSRSCSSRSSRPSRSGKGTGLGLSVSYGIIESYGGTIGYRRQRVGRRHVLLRAAGDRACRAADHARQTASTETR